MPTVYIIRDNVFFLRIAANRLCKCQQIPSKGLLARELLGLWGFDMVEEVASVIAHRDALVAEFEVKI